MEYISWPKLVSMNFLYVYVEISIRQITGEMPRYIGLNALNIISISTSIWTGVGWSCLRVPFESLDLSGGGVELPEGTV